MRQSFPTLSVMAAVSMCALSACVNVLPEEPRPEAVFRLADAETTIAAPALLVVREPEAPRLFAGRQIAAEGENEGLRVVRGIAWADRATLLFQVSLVDSFDESGAGYAVDDAAGISGDYELYWRITDFSLKRDEGVCRLRLTLMDGASRTPVAQGNATGRVMAEGAGPQARARALSRAGRACVSEAAQFVAGEMEPVADADAP